MPSSVVGDFTVRGREPVSIDGEYCRRRTCYNDTPPRSPGPRDLQDSVNRAVPQLVECEKSNNADEEPTRSRFGGM